jgi:hypothetical protein
MEKKTWMGDPGECDCCKSPFTTAFSDIRTKFGSWGNFCDGCLPSYAIGRKAQYGTGLGQRYEKQGKQWVKTQG